LARSVVRAKGSVDIGVDHAFCGLFDREATPAIACADADE